VKRALDFCIRVLVTAAIVAGLVAIGLPLFPTFCLAFIFGLVLEVVYPPPRSK